MRMITTTTTTTTTEVTKVWPVSILTGRGSLPTLILSVVLIVTRFRIAVTSRSMAWQGRGPPYWNRCRTARSRSISLLGSIPSTPSTASIRRGILMTKEAVMRQLFRRWTARREWRRSRRGKTSARIRMTLELCPSKSGGKCGSERPCKLAGRGCFSWRVKVAVLLGRGGVLPVVVSAMIHRPNGLTQTATERKGQWYEGHRTLTYREPSRRLQEVTAQTALRSC